MQQRLQLDSTARHTRAPLSGKSVRDSAVRMTNPTKQQSTRHSIAPLVHLITFIVSEDCTYYVFCRFVPPANASYQHAALTSGSGRTACILEREIISLVQPTNGVHPAARILPYPVCTPTQAQQHCRASVPRQTGDNLVIQKLDIPPESRAMRGDRRCHTVCIPAAAIQWLTSAFFHLFVHMQSSLSI